MAKPKSFILEWETVNQGKYKRADYDVFFDKHKNVYHGIAMIKGKRYSTGAVRSRGDAEKGVRKLIDNDGETSESQPEEDALGAPDSMSRGLTTAKEAKPQWWGIQELKKWAWEKFGKNSSSDVIYDALWNRADEMNLEAFQKLHQQGQIQDDQDMPDPDKQQLSMLANKIANRTVNRMRTNESLTEGTIQIVRAQNQGKNIGSKLSTILGDLQAQPNDAEIRSSRYSSDVTFRRGAKRLEKDFVKELDRLGVKYNKYEGKTESRKGTDMSKKSVRQIIEGGKEAPVVIEEAAPRQERLLHMYLPEGCATCPCCGTGLVEKGATQSDTPSRPSAGSTSTQGDSNKQTTQADKLTHDGKSAKCPGCDSTFSYTASYSGPKSSTTSEGPGKTYKGESMTEMGRPLGFAKPQSHQFEQDDDDDDDDEYDGDADGDDGDDSELPKTPDLDNDEPEQPAQPDDKSQHDGDGDDMTGVLRKNNEGKYEVHARGKKYEVSNQDAVDATRENKPIRFKLNGDSAKYNENQEFEEVEALYTVGEGPMVFRRKFESEEAAELWMTESEETDGQSYNWHIAEDFRKPRKKAKTITEGSTAQPKKPEDPEGVTTVGAQTDPHSTEEPEDHGLKTLANIPPSVKECLLCGGTNSKGIFESNKCVALQCEACGFRTDQYSIGEGMWNTVSGQLAPDRKYGEGGADDDEFPADDEPMDDPDVSGLPGDDDEDLTSLLSPSEPDEPTEVPPPGDMGGAGGEEDDPVMEPEEPGMGGEPEMAMEPGADDLPSEDDLYDPEPDLEPGQVTPLAPGDGNGPAAPPSPPADKMGDEPDDGGEMGMAPDMGGGGRQKEIDAAIGQAARKIMAQADGDDAGDGDAGDGDDNLMRMMRPEATEDSNIDTNKELDPEGDTEKGMKGAAQGALGEEKSAAQVLGESIIGMVPLVCSHCKWSCMREDYDLELHEGACPKCGTGLSEQVSLQTKPGPTHGLDKDKGKMDVKGQNSDTASKTVPTGSSGAIRTKASQSQGKQAQKNEAQGTPVLNPGGPFPPAKDLPKGLAAVNAMLKKKGAAPIGPVQLKRIAQYASQNQDVHQVAKLLNMERWMVNDILDILQTGKVPDLGPAAYNR